MPTPTLANVPKFQRDALPIVVGGASTPSQVLEGGRVVRKWTPAATGINGSAVTVDANGHVFLPTGFLDLSGCRSLTALVERIGSSDGAFVPDGDLPEFFTWGLYNDSGPPPATFTEALLTGGGFNSYTARNNPIGGPAGYAVHVLLDGVLSTGVAAWTVRYVAAKIGTLNAIASELTFSIARNDGDLVPSAPLDMLAGPYALGFGFATYEVPIVFGTGTASDANALRIGAGFAGFSDGYIALDQVVVFPTGGGPLGAAPPATLWFQQRVDAADVPPTSRGAAPNLGLQFCGMSQANDATLTFPAASVAGESQRALVSWDLSEIMGLAGTAGSQQADARLLLSFDDEPVDAGNLFWLTLWGTS